MDILTILGLLLGVILLFLFFAYWRSQPTPAAAPTAEEEFLVRIDHAQSLLEEEQLRRASVETERNEIAIELNRLKAKLADHVSRAQYDALTIEHSELHAAMEALKSRLQLAEDEIASKSTDLALLETERESLQERVAGSANDSLGTENEMESAPPERDELQNELEETNSKLQEALALTGEFPIQALEINRLKSDMELVSAERDDLKAKVTEAAVYIRDVQKRYQIVLDKMRQMLVQKERDSSGESLAPLRAEVEHDELDSQSDIAPDDSQVAVSVSQLLSKNERHDATEVHSVDDYIVATEGGNGVAKQPNLTVETEVEVAPELSAAVMEIEKSPPEATELAVKGKSVDLQVIKGIGKAYSQRLHEAGIRNLPELVVAKPDDLREITGIKKWHKADPESWINQARQLLASS